MNYDVVIARYGEIGLKSSKVRARFERKLVKNIKAAIDCEVDRNQCGAHQPTPCVNPEMSLISLACTHFASSGIGAGP